MVGTLAGSRPPYPINGTIYPREWWDFPKKTVKIEFTLAMRNGHGIRHVANMSIRIKVPQFLYKNPNNFKRYK